MNAPSEMIAAAADLRSPRPTRQARGVQRVQAREQAGDPLAAYAIGTWLLHGTHGYLRDEAKAASYLQYAADRHVPEAIYDLGILTEMQRLGTKPRRDAFNRYLTAALLGDRDAAGEVVRCVYYGVGTFANRQGAERLFEALSGEETQRPVAAE